MIGSYGKYIACFFFDNTNQYKIDGGSMSNKKFISLTGIRAGLSSDPDQVYGGVHFNLGELTKDVRFRPSVEVGFGDDQTVVQMLAEVHYVFSKFQTWKPYLGGGLGLTYVNYDDGHRGDGSDTEGSLNAIGGIETELKQGMKLFFEFKLGLAHQDPDIKFGIGLSWK
jgi:opacity protein-like surface antigen